MLNRRSSLRPIHTSIWYTLLLTYGSWFCDCTDIETNECLQNNGGCWEDKTTNITACRVKLIFLVLLYYAYIYIYYVYVSVKEVSLLQDTFRGRVCQCPIVQGVKFLGDGYTQCEGKKNSNVFYDHLNDIIFHMFKFGYCSFRGTALWDKQWRMLETNSNGKNIFGLPCNMAYLKTN